VGLGVELPLPLVRAVVDGQGGHHRAERAEGGNGLVEVVLEDLDPAVVGEAPACGVEHHR
jgi:hypothetical protein